MKRFLILCGLAAALFADVSVPAVLMTPLAIEELAAQAQLVVRGTVLAKTTQRDANGRIFTRVELQVGDVWKGRANGQKIEIVHGGGILGEERVEVSGQAEFTPGEEVVAFLVLNPRGQAVTLGLAQGKFEIFQDSRTGEKLARNLFHGQGGSGSEKASPLPAASHSRLSLGSFKQRVQEANR